ncbi:MAG TPA: hypothetical protein PLY93_03375 [Turneriella sp.]|nr:hypothetical protein [Turneriella sp.]
MNSHLLIDTSTRYLVFARLGKEGGEKILTPVSLDAGDTAIDSAVATLFPSLDALDAIWLGLGPGSFVGLRSSFAYVRMLSMLSQKPVYTFFSSRLWRAFFNVRESDWFLTRTNAKLFYAERYASEREAKSLELSAATSLVGNKFFWMDSWLSQAKSVEEKTIIKEGKALYFADAQIKVSFLTQTLLQPQRVEEHTDLAPIYGHELNFTLAKPKLK